MIPTSILFIWFRGLFSLALITGAIYLAHEWQQHSWRWDETLRQSSFMPDLGWNNETALLCGAIVLTLLVFFGKGVNRFMLSLSGHVAIGSGASLEDSPAPTEEQMLSRPDGSQLKVMFYGSKDAVPLVLTHGWGLDNREWNYLKRELSSRYRLVVWDEPGLGLSKRPTNRDYSLENFAGHLEAVLSLVNKPAILVGHSIGGMITLTFCRLFPKALEGRVAGLVLTHTTHTNPVTTTTGATVLKLIEKPILVPMMYLTILLSPFLRLSNWLSYLNGSMHTSTKVGSFAGTETWEQIDFIARFQVRASPAVLARGMLGMMRYDATNVLSTITVPTLIVAGDKDLVTKPSASKYMESHIAGARLVTLTPGNHMGLIEQHVAYAESIRNFADGIAQLPADKA